MEVSGFQNTGRNLMSRSVKPWRSTFKSPTLSLIHILVQQRPDDIVRVGIDTAELSVTKAESKATYGEIQARVKAQTGLNVTPLYIAQVKRKHGKMCIRDRYVATLCKKPRAMENTRFFHQMPQQWQTYLASTQGKERKNCLLYTSRCV